MTPATRIYGRTSGGQTPQQLVMFFAEYADLPSPADHLPGALAFVNLDPNPAKNGLHGVFGDGVGEYWNKL